MLKVWKHLYQTARLKTVGTLCHYSRCYTVKRHCWSKRGRGWKEFSFTV